MKPITWCLLPFCTLGLAASGHATQLHGDPEGLYVHQVSHIFFACCMAALIYWLRARHLVQSRGWRYIQYAAGFFIVWSLDAALAHFMDEQMSETLIHRAGPWHVQVETGRVWLNRLYYIVKLDHLLCAPAMILLYMGLKELHLQRLPIKPKTTGSVSR